MRDLVVLVFTFGSAFLGFTRPWLGVLALAVLAYFNPHRYAWTFARELPVYLIVFAATMLGVFINGKERQPFPWTRETRLFMALLFWFTLTTFWTPDFPGPAKEQWAKVMKVYAGLLPTFWMINSRERLRWLLLIIALSFGLLGLKGGVFALGTGFNYWVRGPEGTFYGDNNHFGLALNMTLPLLLLFAKETRSLLAKKLFYASFFFSILAVLGTRSRGALLTLGAVLLAVVLNSRRKWLAIPLVILGIAVIVPKLPEKWFARMETIQTYEEDRSASNRLTVWEWAVDRALADPLTGGGFETFRNALTGAHSGYFGILGEHGFVALALWCSLLFGSMVALERLRRQALYVPGTEWMRDYGRAIQISLLGYAVGGAFLNVHYWDYFYHLIVICALMKVLMWRAHEAHATVPASEGEEALAGAGHRGFAGRLGPSPTGAHTGLPAGQLSRRPAVQRLS